MYEESAMNTPAHSDVMGYQKEGKMAHDDAEDCLAGIYDRTGRGNLFSFS